MIETGPRQQWGTLDRKECSAAVLIGCAPLRTNSLASFPCKSDKLRQGSRPNPSMALKTTESEKDSVTTRGCIIVDLES